MVEFALTIGLLLVVLLGLIEFALWFESYLAVQHASREGARYAVSGRPTYSECMSEGYSSSQYGACRVAHIKEVAKAVAGSGVFADESVTDQSLAYFLGVFVSSAQGADDAGDAKEKVQVTVVYNHRVLNPLLSAFLPTVRVVGVTEMINEPWAGGGEVEVPPEIPPEVLEPLDSDGDGWSDVHEVQNSGTLPGSPDTDGDVYCEGVRDDWSSELASQCAGYDDHPLDPDRH